MEEELKQYALQLKLQNPEITQEELTNKIIEFKNTLNVKTEPQEPGFYEKFFAGVDLLKKMPQNQDPFGLKKGVIDVSAKTAAITIGLGQGMIEDPVGTLEGLGREAPQALPKFANTVADMVFDNYKDLEEWGSITVLSALQSLRKEKSLSAEEKLGIQRMAQSSIAMKDRILSKIPFLPSIISTSREDINSFKEKMNSYTTQHENTITEEFLKGKDANFGEIAGRMIADGVGSLPYTLASINPYTAAAMGAGLAADKFITEFEENPERGLFNLSANAIGTGAIELADAYLTRRFLQTANVLKGGKGTTTKAVEEFQKGASDKFLDILGVSVKEGGTEVGQALATRLLDAIPSYFQIGLDKQAFGKEGSIIKDIYSIIDEGIIGALTGGGVTTFGKIAQSKSILKQRAESLLTPNVTVKKLQDLKKSFVEKNIQIQTAQEAGEIEKVNALKKIQSKIKSEILGINAQNRLGLEALEGENLIKYANNVDAINALSKGENNTQNDINKLISENQNLYNTAIQNKYGDNINFAKAAAGQLGFSEPVIAKTTAEFEKKFKDLTGKVIKDSDGVNGVFIGQGKVIINEEVALKQGAVGVGSHEILHPILNAMVGSAAAQGQIVNEFKNSMTSAQKKWVEGEMLRQGKVEGTQEYNTEYLTVFSEGIARKQINFDQSVFEKIKDFLTGRYKKQGFKNIDFVSGQGVYNFMREYAKSIEKGKLTEEVLGVLDKKIIQDIGVIGQQKSSEISNKVQELYESGDPVSIFEILNEYRVMASKQAQRFRDVPGYATNYDLLVDEILTGRRGVYDLIKEYNPNKGVPLAAYINKFLKSRVIEAANRILDTKFKSDITEAKGVTAAPEISEEAKISEERPSLRKTLGLNDQVVDKVKNAVIKTFGTRLPNVSTPQFVKELQKRYRTELKPTIAKMMGTQESYSDFLNENFRLIYDILPQSIINKRFSAFAEPVLDDTGKQRREKTAQGNAVFRKKKITRKEFVDYFIGEDVKPSTRGTRKTALAEALSEEIAFDATMSVIKTPEVFTKINAINGLIENYTSEVAKQIDRSIDFQFSKESALGPEALLAEEKELLRNAVISGQIENFSNYPELYEIIEKLFLANGLPKSSTFKGNTFEFYIQEKGNSMGHEGITFEGDGAAGNTGVDLLIKITDKNGNIISIPTEVKLDSEAQIGSSSFIIDSNGEIRSTDSIGPSGDIFIGAVKEKLPLYKKMNKRAEEIEGRKIPFDLKFSYKPSTMEQLRNEFGKSNLMIKINLNDLKILESHYNKKGVYYIYFGARKNTKTKNRESEGGFFYLGQNPEGLNAIKLEGGVVVTISFSSSKTNKKTGLADYRLRARYSLDSKTKNLPNSYKIENKNFTEAFMPSMEKGNLDQEINDMIENKTGIGSEKRYAAAKAAVAGKDKGRFDLLGIPPSAQDFMGLMYKIVGKGKKGDQHLAWFKTNLLDPFAKAMVTISNERVKIGEKFKEIKSIANIAPKDLSKKIPGEPFTVEQAIRTYVWTQQGMEIPGLSKADKKELNKYVSEKENLLVFANQLMQLSPANVYPKPDNNWLAGTLTTDLLTSLNTTTRKEALAEWQNNVDVIFSEANMNKLEAAFGKGYRSALENMLQRMQTGRNRGFAGDSLTGRFVDWLNGSVGAIMFFNMRSAVLQTISAVNFVNWSDNNPLKAAAAFANQPQYWGDVVYLMNSDYLVERRNGLKINVNEADIAELAAESKNKAKAFVNKLLKLGFLPTQIADSFAIATGGATFYRNRIKSYVKDGMPQKEAEEKAFLDFREISEESQQSSRPDRISQQQAGPLGRLILAFANTPAQYARLIQKASSDLANGRGDAKTNISKIAYYGAIQNVIFNAMQQALFAMMYGDEPEDEKKSEKYGNIINGMVDSLLRGTGFAGAAVSTVKNTLLKVAEGKPAQDSAIELINISPPISSKIRKVRSAGRTFDWNKKEIKEKGLSLDNPAAMAIGQLVSATTNVPLDRGVKKLTNIKDALDSENEEWIRVATALGWSKWELEWKKDKRKKKKKKSSMKTLKF